MWMHAPNGCMRTPLGRYGAWDMPGASWWGTTNRRPAYPLAEQRAKKPHASQYKVFVLPLDNMTAIRSSISNSAIPQFRNHGNAGLRSAPEQTTSVGRQHMRKAADSGRLYRAPWRQTGHPGQQDHRQADLVHSSGRAHRRAVHSCVRGHYLADLASSSCKWAGVQKRRSYFFRMAPESQRKVRKRLTKEIEHANFRIPLFRPCQGKENQP
jgi:hypothetical protein